MSFTRTRTFSRKASSATTYIAAPKLGDIPAHDELDDIMNSDNEQPVKKTEKKVIIPEKKTGVVDTLEDKENAPNKKISSAPSTPGKRTTSTPSKDTTPTKRPRNATPTKRTPKSTPTKAKSTPTTTPTKATPKKATPTKRTPPKKTTPTKLTRSASDGGGSKSPSRLPRTSTSMGENYYKTSKVVDELEYLFDGIERQPEVMGDCIYQLAKMTRAGGQAISLALNSQGFVTRLADALMARWIDKDKCLKSNLAASLGATIILHSLAKDGENVVPLSRCIPMLQGILDADTWAPKGADEEYAKVTKLVDGMHFVNDYMQCEANTRMLALRTLAALTFTRQEKLGDTLRTHGVIDSVITCLAGVVSKINPSNPSTSSLVDVKYALVFLENATILSVENRTHMVEEGPLLPTLLQVLDIARSCVSDNSSPKEGLLDAAVDCINGALKSLLNITYNCDSACVKVAVGSDGNTKGSKGLQVLVSLLSLSFPGIENFDIQQHTIGLLVNLVEQNVANRKKFGLVDGAIQQVVNVFLEAGIETENSSNDIEGLVEGKVRAAYAAMLLGCLLRDNLANLVMVRELLAKHKIESLTPLVHILRQFVLFQAKAGILASDVYKSTQEIVQYIQSIEVPPSNNNNGDE